MPIQRTELDEKETKAVPKKPRRTTVKNASFFLYKKDKNDGSLSPIGSFDTELDVIIAYEHALDEGIPQEQLVGYKGRPLDFAVKHTKRLIRVR